MEQQQQPGTTIEDALRLLYEQGQQTNLTMQQMQAQQAAFNESMTQKMDNIETRLVALETKSRPPTPPARAMDVEPRVTFPATPPASPAVEPAATAPETPMFGATGLPVTPAPGKAALPERAARPERRETMHLRELKDSEARAQVPVMHSVMAKYDHITYTKPGVKNFQEFWHAISQYEELNNTKLAPCAMIDFHVREKLISKDYARYGNGKFMKLTREELYTLMQSQFRPGDKLEFIASLTKNVDFEISANYRPTPEYFMPFYDALLQFTSKFIQVYEILIVGIEDMNIVPRVENKEGGLVQIFVGKIPFEYGVRIIRLMGASKWETLRVFTKQFRVYVEAGKQQSDAARSLRRTFGGTRYEAVDREQKFKRLQQLCSMQVAGDTEDPDLDAAVEAAWEEFADDIANMLAVVNHKQPQKKPAFDKERAPLVCITKILHGVCNKPGCSYVHREDMVAQKRLEMLGLIEKQIAAQKDRGAPHRAAPQRAAAVEDAFVDSYDDEEY